MVKIMVGGLFLTWALFFKFLLCFGQKLLMIRVHFCFEASIVNGVLLQIWLSEIPKPHRQGCENGRWINHLFVHRWVIIQRLFSYMNLGPQAYASCTGDQLQPHMCLAVQDHLVNAQIRGTGMSSEAHWTAQAGCSCHQSHIQSWVTVSEWLLSVSTLP